MKKQEITTREFIYKTRQALAFLFACPWRPHEKALKSKDKKVNRSTGLTTRQEARVLIMASVAAHEAAYALANVKKTKQKRKSK